MNTSDSTTTESRPQQNETLRAQGFIGRPLSIEDICADAFADELSSHKELITDARTLRNSILARMHEKVVQANRWLKHEYDKDAQLLHCPSALPPKIIARCMTFLYDIAAIMDPSGSYMLGVREMHPDNPEHPNHGIYRIDEDAIRSLALECGADPNKLKGIMTCLVSESESSGAAPRRETVRNRHQTAMGNGIFDYETQQLLPYTEDTTHTVKTPLCFRPCSEPSDGNLTPTKILHDLFPDPDVYELAWDIICATLRPNEIWKRIVLLYGTGSNGKSTFLKILQGLVGEGNYAILSLESFNTEVELHALVGKMLNTGLDNNGVYLERMRILKNIAMGEPFLVRALYHMAFMYTFSGLNVQAINELPRVKEKTYAVYRRLLILPFEAVFKDDSSNENAIKVQEFIARKDVLEWIAYHALYERTQESRGHFYELDDIDATKLMLHEYRKSNDVVAEFWYDEVLEYAKGCFIPFDFLYLWFTCWAHEHGVHSKNIPGQKQVTERITEMATSAPDSCWVERRLTIDHWMVIPEPVVRKYTTGCLSPAGSRLLHDWFSPMDEVYFTNIPKEKHQMRGLLLNPVADWCEAHKTKPYKFIKDHCNSMRYLPGDAIGQFVSSILDGTISDSVWYGKGMPQASSAPNTTFNPTDPGDLRTINGIPL